MTSKTDIDRLLRLGEDSVCEFKSMRIPGNRVVSPDSKDIADDIASVANAAGATFLFGVNDKTHEVEGIPEDKLEIAEAWARDICNDSVRPAVPATIRKVIVFDSAGAERCILRVDVPKSLFVHESPHGYFYRIGSSKRKMPPEMLARLFQQRSQTRLICFDEQIVSQADVTELIPSLYSRFRTELSSVDDREFLRKLHFVSIDVDGVVRPTVSGVLLHKIATSSLETKAVQKGIEGINEGLNGIINGDEGINKGLNETIIDDEGIKTVISRNPGVRVPQMAVILGKSRQTVERYVADLKRRGVIEYRGSKKTGGYYILEGE